MIATFIFIAVIRVSNKFYSLVSLLFVFLSLIGYQIVTTIFLQSSTETSSVIRSQSVTYPYRAFVLFLSLILIISSPVKKNHIYSRHYVNIYLVFLFLYYFRVIIDIYFRNIFVSPEYRTSVIQYLFLSIIPTVWAMIRCVMYLDFDKLNKWLMIGGVLLLILLFFQQNSLLSYEYEETVRRGSNVALGTLGLGYSSLSLIIVFLSFIFYYRSHNLLWKIVLAALSLLSFILLLRSASRGPLICFLVIILTLVSTKLRNRFVAFFISSIIVFFVWINISSILDWLGTVSPLMETRMSATVYESDSSGRDSLYKEAFSFFLQSPLWGKQFVLSDGMYCHNSILDVMIGLGFFGALLWVYILYKTLLFAYRLLLDRSMLVIVSLLTIQFILKSFFSGSICISNELALCMIIVLSHPVNNKSRV